MSEKEYYTGLLIPIIGYDIILTARDKWKQADHERRWEQRYAKPYPQITMSTGTWQGVTFVK